MTGHAAEKQRVFITGTAGFIGFHLARLLLAEGYVVAGYDGMTEYYDVALKRRRHQILFQHPHFSATEAMLEDGEALHSAMSEFAPDIVIHLAAQAGVRHSVEQPQAFVDANIIGTFHMLEAVKAVRPQHVLMASTSSVYGANDDMPFTESQAVANPLSIYSATKVAGEAMAHSYAHLYHIPMTMFRFFTVYGPWGRPDLALFKFVAAMLDGKAIDVYNNGQMARDFTYIADLVRAVHLLMDVVPAQLASRDRGDYVRYEGDSLSPVAPWRVVNIGNGDKIALMDFIQAIEQALGISADCHYMDMQLGDIPETWADCGLLDQLIGYRPQTKIVDGVKIFVEWYRDYYEK